MDEDSPNNETKPKPAHSDPIEFRQTKVALSNTTREEEDDKGEGKGSVHLSYAAPGSQKSTTVDSMIAGGPNSSHMMTKSHHGSHDNDVQAFDSDDQSDALTSNADPAPAPASIIYLPNIIHHPHIFHPIHHSFFAVITLTLPFVNSKTIS